METQSLGGAKYFLTFLDDYSKKVFVYILNKKTKILSKFKEFKTEVENQSECKLKCIRTDNGLEYVNKPFSDFLISAGIRHQTTTHYTPEQNGAAERLNRTLVERAKCMILNAGLAKFFWAEAIKTAAYIINRFSTRSLSFKTPEEVWSGHKPNVSHMKVFGCEAMVQLPKEKRKKWDPKVQKMIFIGYCENTKGYSPVRDRETVKRNYAALELSEKENKTLDIQCKNNEENRKETYNSDSSYNTTKNNSDSDEYLLDVKIDTPSPSNITLRPRNKNKEQTYLCYDECVVPEQVPDTYKEAISCENAKKWKKSIEEKLEAHRRNGTWILVNKPENTNIIGSKWIFRVKDQPTGPRFESRLCGKGYAQAKGIDYKETFSPTVRVPVDPHSRLEKSVQLPDKNLPYREAVGSLMHVAILSRPYIMFAVNLVSRFLNCYDESHWTAVKKILKYLKDTINYGLCYITSSKSSELIGFSDADYANDVTTRRSTTGYIFIKNGAAVTWSSQRQHTVALSITEAEFMAACAATKEVIWIKQLLCDLARKKKKRKSLHAAMISPRESRHRRKWRARRPVLSRN
ncbi:Retrovirus-related Pol polyprotein from transposon TNT 1-94 [Eumeta japonica]|uniref:Retrovirus-related Pol polyprotein from transposon TNT 1-94 n=1 Tax=Eumeta variegata TaxID=151549 RepID=A0A4C1UK42_EUMVA|nr:Retrovirus-related Pol polyprotein from transposon TNT 1-94 [Eumeta japonica]